MMRRLRPAILDDLGLVAAIEAELQSWQLRYPSTECKFSSNCAQLIIDEAINISLYRIVQEALTNIAKHSQATMVSVDMNVKVTRDNEKILSLQIKDNGRGMNLNEPGSGLGLLGMRERVEALNGKFQITAEPGKGVLLEVDILIRKDD